MVERMENPIIHVRDFGDGTWSVMARVWNPQKTFWEHPKLINLTYDEALEKCQEVINNKPSIEEIINTWEYIGD